MFISAFLDFEGERHSSDGSFQAWQLASFINFFTLPRLFVLLQHYQIHTTTAL